MDEWGSADSLLFDRFRLDRRGGCLFRLDEAGVAEPIPLGGRGLALLALLLERHGELISRDGRPRQSTERWSFRRDEPRW
jgi:DNA-binding winged helix-turn-helix (wHTH) protein